MWLSTRTAVILVGGLWTLLSVGLFFAIPAQSCGDAVPMGAANNSSPMSVCAPSPNFLIVGLIGSGLLVMVIGLVLPRPLTPPVGPAEW